jgi:hypothetical protein
MVKAVPLGTSLWNAAAPTKIQLRTKSRTKLRFEFAMVAQLRFGLGAP